MKTKRITEEEFLERVIDKELELAGAPVRYKDIAGEEGELKYPDWYDKYYFADISQYEEWKKYWMEQVRLIKGKSHLTKSQLDRYFSWFSLDYGLYVKK